MHQTLRKGGRREKLKHLPCMSKILDWIWYPALLILLLLTRTILFWSFIVWEQFVMQD
jgi:hypothetical protein